MADTLVLLLLLSAKGDADGERQCCGRLCIVSGGVGSELYGGRLGMEITLIQ